MHWHFVRYLVGGRSIILAYIGPPNYQKDLLEYSCKKQNWGFLLGNDNSDIFPKQKIQRILFGFISKICAYTTFIYLLEHLKSLKDEEETGNIYTYLVSMIVDCRKSSRDEANFLW